jgi:hypothetical protein
MPRPRTIFVDRIGMLKSIATQVIMQRDSTHKAADEDAAFFYGGHIRMDEAEREKRVAACRQHYLDKHLPETDWVPRNLETLAGKPLTSSERIRHQQAMRAMEGDGLTAGCD